MSMSLLAKSESTRKFKTGCCCFPWPKRRPRDEGRHPPLRPSFEIESGLQLQHLQDHASQPISHGGVLQEASPPPAVALRIPHPLEDPPGTPQPPLQPPILQDNSTHPPRAGVALGYSISSFTYEELSVATNGFSADNFLGKGGFGLVHKGVLPNGKEVAVKQLKAGSLQGEREFRAEVEVISRVHHKHLVSLVGYCISASQMMVVYDFVPNNTLEFHLHGQETIDWPKRQRIALGSAKGLAYLHEDCHSKIVHRDIKASNILLNSNFEAKVADFGLAKCLSDSETHVSTRVMGTKGYLDPEYASSGKLTNKSDVFSFGVVLLELITGHQPLGLVDQARRFLTRALEQNNFDALVDPKLQNDYDLTEMTRMVTCAAACVHRSARRRPLMSQIVRGLEGDVDALSKLSKGVRPNTQIEKMASGSEESGASSSWESSASNQARAYASDLHGSSRKGKTIRGVGLPTVEESGASLSGEFGASNQVRAQASDLPGSSRKDKTIRGVGLPKVEEYGASNQARAQDTDLPGSSTEGKTEEDLPTGWDRVPESGASSSGESGAIKLGLGTSQ